MKLSDDSYAILLLCSELGIKNAKADVKPYTISQWHSLYEKLSINGLTPSSLFNISSEIRDRANLSVFEVERIEKLFALAGQLGVELSIMNEKGISTVTISDVNYPHNFKNKLGKFVPPVLFYAGNIALLNNKGVAIVGSRNIDDNGMRFTEKLSMRCTNDGLNIISGGARGVDSIAENIANKADGTTVIFVADSLEKKIRQKETREAIMKKQTIILSAYRPDMPFQSYIAMERNKYVYSLSSFVVVVSSDYMKGGTWAGAIENHKRAWTPMFVRREENIPQGNAKLLEMRNVHPFNNEVLNDESINIYNWFTDVSTKARDIEKASRTQISMFDLMN